MNKTQESLEMAIEALESFEKVYGDTDLLMPHNFYKSLQSCKEALAQPTQEPVALERDYNFMRDLAIGCEDALNELHNQEPVAWMELKEDAGHTEITVWQEPVSKKSIPLYTHPAPQPAQEPVAYDKLTNDEKASIKRQINDAFNEGFEKGKAMSLVASIPPNFIRLESIDNPAPSWQGLTNEELDEIGQRDLEAYDFARAIEQALKEKNT